MEQEMRQAGSGPKGLSAVQRMVERQARAWERNDFDLAAADWLPDGVLVAPGGPSPNCEGSWPNYTPVSRPSRSV
jgi:hypothetical protein